MKPIHSICLLSLYTNLTMLRNGHIELLHNWRQSLNGNLFRNMIRQRSHLCSDMWVLNTNRKQFSSRLIENEILYWNKRPESLKQCSFTHRICLRMNTQNYGVMVGKVSVEHWTCEQNAWPQTLWSVCIKSGLVSNRRTSFGEYIYSVIFD